MARPLQHGDAETVRLTLEALDLLRAARDKLAKAGSTVAAAKVRLAITSTGGAVRHAQERYRSAFSSVTVTKDSINV